MKVVAFILFVTLSGQLLSQKVVLYAPKTSAKWSIKEPQRTKFNEPGTLAATQNKPN
jgi:hypothetical protein